MEAKKLNETEKSSEEKQSVLESEDVSKDNSRLDSGHHEVAMVDGGSGNHVNPAVGGSHGNPGGGGNPVKPGVG